VHHQVRNLGNLGAVQPHKALWLLQFSPRLQRERHRRPLEVPIYPGENDKPQGGNAGHSPIQPENREGTRFSQEGQKDRRREIWGRAAASGSGACAPNGAASTQTF
jgi:hypothetical protein